MVTSINTLSQSQIQSLLQAETTQLEKPIIVWQGQIKNDQAEISAWGTIGSAMSALDGALDGIGDLSSLNDRSATTSASDVATISAQRNAIVGSYAITDAVTASTQSIYSGSYTDRTSTVGAGAGAMTFTTADGQTQMVNLDGSDTTLEGVANAVNEAGGGLVNASVVGGDGGYRLVFTSADTGANAAFSITGSGSLAGLSYSAASPGAFTLATSAGDASMKINGVPVTNATNVFDNAIPGAEITLSGTGSADLSVKESSSALSGALSTLVGKFNAAVSAIHSVTKFGGTGATATGNGPLLGNYSATSMASRLDGAVASLAGDGLSSAAMGLTMNKDGSVSFDSGTFASAYADNPDGAATLVNRLHDEIKSITQAATGSPMGGTVAQRTDSLQDSIKNLNGRISDLSVSINNQIVNSSNAFSTLLGVQQKYSVWNNYFNIMFSDGDNS